MYRYLKDMITFDPNRSALTADRYTAKAFRDS